MIKTLIIIGTGGFLGSILRYLISRFFHNFAIMSFPIGTLVVNVIGCLLIGIFYGVMERSSLISDDWRVFLTIGFCGGFTTFSTFAHENLTLLKSGDFLSFTLYTGLSVFLCIMAVYIGNLSTRIL